MKRRVNLRFLAYLLVALAILGGGSYFLHAYQVKHNAHALLEKANREKDGGHLPEAVKSYRRYLQLVPNDGDALADYGLTLDQSSKARRDQETVFFVLDKALRFNPHRDDARRRLVDVSMKFGRYTDAQDHLKKLMEQSPDDAKLEYQLGRCLEGTGYYDKAAEQYERAIEHEPAQVESYVRLAELWRQRLNKAQDTEELMEEMVVANSKAPTLAEAYVARARYYRLGGAGIDREAETLTRALIGAETVTCFAGNGVGPNCLNAALAVQSGGGRDLLFKAEQDLRKARAARPDDLEVLLLSADVARARNWFDQGERYARRGLELYPKEIHLYEQGAALAELQGHRDEAVTMLRQGEKELPEERALPFLLAEFLLAEGHHKEAAEPIAKLKTMRVEPALLTYLDGRRKFAQGDWLGASQSLELAYPALVHQPEKARQTAMLLGQCYQQLGDADEQYKAYRRALSEDPSDPLWLDASVGVANALLALNKIDEAVEMYHRLIPRAPAVRLALARLLIARNLNLPEGQREWREVDQLLAEAALQYPNSSEVPILRALVLAAGTGNKEASSKEASKLLEKAQEDAPTDVSVWVTRAGLASAQGKPADALKMLDLATKAAGDSVDLRLARLRYLLQMEDKSVVNQELAKLEENAEKFSPAEQQRLLQGLAQAYTALGLFDKTGFDKAQQLWERIAVLKPNDLTVQTSLFDLALLRNDDDRLEVVLSEIRRLEGDKGTLWRYGKAARLVTRGQNGDKAALEEARSLLAAVALQRPSWSRVPACQGKCEMLAGKPDTAIRYYLLAIELGERNSRVLQEAIGLLYDRQRYEDALQVIRKLPEQAPLVNQLSGVVVDLSLRTKDNNTALKVAEKAVADNPKDYRSHLYLAQVYWALDKRDQAEKALRAALTVADTIPQTWTMLVVFLAKTDRIDDAKKVISEASAKLPVDKNRSTYAYCYEVVGDLKEAEQLHNAALKETPNEAAVLQAAAGFFLRTGKNDEAKHCLEHLIKLNQQFPEEAAKARQLLAFLLVSEPGDYDQKREVLAKMGFLNPSAEKVATESPDDKRVRALLQAAQGRRRDREEAVRTLEEISQLQPLAAGDLFNLAILYQSLGNKGKVRSLMQTVLGKETDNPQYVAYYAQFLLAQKELDQAEVWISRLEKSQRKAGRTYELKAKLLHAQGKNAAAVDLLNQYATEKDAPLLPIAILLEQIGQTTGDNKPAERMFEKVVEKSKKPEASLILAGFYSRTGRVPAALDLCDRLRATCPPELVMTMSLLILYENNAGKADLQRVEGWLNAALTAAEKDPKQRANLRQQLATMYSLQNRIDEAEKTYRRCLEENPRDVLSMNNLAWLLALKGNKTDEAQVAIEKAIAVAGPRVGLRDTLAMVYLAQRKADLALRELEEIATDNPTPTDLFHLALAQKAANKKTEARDSLHQAMERGLKERDLHPFERDRYRKLLADLELR